MNSSMTSSRGDIAGQAFAPAAEAMEVGTAGLQQSVPLRCLREALTGGGMIILVVHFHSHHSCRFEFG